MNAKRKLIEYLEVGRTPANALRLANNNRGIRATQLIKEGINAKNAWNVVNKTRNTAVLSYYKTFRSKLSHNNSINAAIKVEKNMRELARYIQKKPNFSYRVSRYINLRLAGHNHNISFLAIKGP